MSADRSQVETMSNEHDLLGQWERVASELRACKEAQRQTWGDIDNTTLGRYLAGEVSHDEQQRVHGALDELPELRKLTELVRELLTDAPPAVEEPAVLPFRPAAAPRRRRWLPLLQRRAALAAAACLLLTFGLLLPREGFLSAPRPDGDDLSRATALADPTLFAPDGGQLLAAGHRATAPPPHPIEANQRALASELHRKALRHGSVAARPRPVHADGSPSPLPGELIRAQLDLAALYQQCQQQVGADHEVTRQVAGQLAGVYKVALNTAPPAAESALVLRERITSRPAAEVRVAVVPVLAQALRRAATAEERRALVNALGQLGPAACDALTAWVPDSSDTAAVRVALHYLGEMGPAALPALERLTARPTWKVGDREKERCCVVVRGLKQGREGRVGVCDATGAVSVRQLREATFALRQLARDAEVEVLIEVGRGGDAGPPAARLAGMGPRAVLIRLDPASCAVEVHASPAVRRDGFAADGLREQLVRRLKRRQVDEALRDGVRSVTTLARAAPRE